MIVLYLVYKKSTDNRTREKGEKMDKIIFDYSKLRGRIKERFENETKFSKAINSSQASLSAKLNNKTYFKPTDIVKILDVLEIPDEEVKLYFFNQKVRKTVRKFAS